MTRRTVPFDEQIDRGAVTAKRRSPWESMLETVVERAVTRALRTVLASRTASISSRGDREDAPCDNQESMDRTNTEIDGDSSWLDKEADLLIDLMNQNTPPRRQKRKPKRSRKQEQGSP